MMRVYELRYPGTWLDGLPPEVAHDAQALLLALDAHLADAALGLALFEGATATIRRPDPTERERRAEEVRAVEAELERRTPCPDDPAEERRVRERVREEAEAIVRRRAWQAGRVPDSYTHRLPFVHAHTVLYALDGIAKALGRLATLPGAPQGVADALSDLNAALPHLRGVRDSAHHVEDRARGRDRRNQVIPLAPFDIGHVRAPGGALVLDLLSGNRLCFTTEAGGLGHVESSPMSVEAAQRAAQRALDAFSWTGPPRVVPD